MIPTSCKQILFPATSCENLILFQVATEDPLQSPVAPSPRPSYITPSSPPINLLRFPPMLPRPSGDGEAILRPRLPVPLCNRALNCAYDHFHSPVWMLNSHIPTCSDPLRSSAGPSSPPPPRRPKRADLEVRTLPPKDTSNIRPNVPREPSDSLYGKDARNPGPDITGPKLVPAHFPGHQSLSSPSSLENIRRSRQSPEQTIAFAAGRRMPTTLSGSVTSVRTGSSLSSASSGDVAPVIDISTQIAEYAPELEASPSDMTFAERPHPSPLDPTIPDIFTAHPLAVSNYQTSPHRPRTVSNVEAARSSPSSHPMIMSAPPEPRKPLSASGQDDSSLSVPSICTTRGSGSVWNNVLKRQKSLAFTSRHLDAEPLLRHSSSFTSPHSVVPPDGATSSSSNSARWSASCASSPLPGSPMSATSAGSALTDSKQCDVSSKQILGPVVEPVSASQTEDFIPRPPRPGRQRGASIATIEPQLVASPSEASGSLLRVMEPVESPANKRGHAADSLGLHILPPSEMERALHLARASEDVHGRLDSPKTKLRAKTNTLPPSPSRSMMSRSDAINNLRRISESHTSTPADFVAPPSLSRQSSSVSKHGRNHVLQRPSTGGGLTSFGGQPIIPPSNTTQYIHSLPPPPRKSHSRVPHWRPSSAERQPLNQVTSTVSVGSTSPIVEKASTQSPNNASQLFPGPKKSRASGRTRRISSTSGTTVTTAVSAGESSEAPKAMISVVPPATTRPIFKQPSFLEISSETDEPERANFLDLDNRASFDADGEIVRT